MRRLRPALMAVLLAFSVSMEATPAASAASAATRVTPMAHLEDLDVPWGISAASTGPIVSRPVELPADAMLVGADWGGAEGVLVELRTKSDGAWSDWTELDADGDHGPDRGAAEPSSTLSAPVIIANAAAVQFRSDTTMLDVVVVVVEEAEGSDGGRVSSAAVSDAAGKPAIVTRAQWGADESIRHADVPDVADTVRFAVVHHTATTNSYSAAQSAGIVRGIYEYHVKGQGWWDIGYNFIIDKYGQVFEGRYGGVDRAVIAAHAPGFNSGSTGIAILGDYRGGVELSSQGRSSLEQLIAWKFKTHNVDPLATTVEVSGSSKSRWAAGESVTIARVVGHRDLKATECPASIIDLVQSGSIAKGASDRLGARVRTDAADRLFGEVIGDTTSIEVSTDQAADWRLEVRDDRGTLVRALTRPRGTTATLVWDHQDGVGSWVTQGSYSMTITATVPGDGALPAITLPLDLTGRLRAWVPLVGDWNGDGKVQPGWWNLGRWALPDGRGGVRAFRYGRSYDAPVVGDWNGDGRDEIGIIRDREWHLRRSASGGPGEIVFTYGRMTRGDLPLVGDWNGDGRDEIGIVRDGEWHLRSALSGGASDHLFTYGRVTRGDTPITGDWNGDGLDTIGVVRGREWHLRNELAGGEANHSFSYGSMATGDLPVVGDWDRDGDTNVGVVRGSDWYLRTAHSDGSTNQRWEYSGS